MAILAKYRIRPKPLLKLATLPVRNNFRSLRKLYRSFKRLNYSSQRTLKGINISKNTTPQKFQMRDRIRLREAYLYFSNRKNLIEKQPARNRKAKKNTTPLSSIFSPFPRIWTIYKRMYFYALSIAVVSAGFILCIRWMPIPPQLNFLMSSLFGVGVFYLGNFIKTKFFQMDRLNKQIRPQIKNPKSSLRLAVCSLADPYFFNLLEHLGSAHKLYQNLIIERGKRKLTEEEIWFIRIFIHTENWLAICIGEKEGVNDWEAKDVLLHLRKWMNWACPGIETTFPELVNPDSISANTPNEQLFLGLKRVIQFFREVGHIKHF